MLRKSRQPIESLRRLIKISYRCNSNISNEFVSLSPSLEVQNTAILTLHSKSSKNAFSKAMLNSFNDYIHEIAEDSTIRCLIINSSIPNIFCVGADLKERIAMTDEEVGPFVSLLRNSFDKVASLEIPTIAAIDGAALGGGLELALACDIRISSKQSIIGLTETSLAIIPGAGGTQRLSRLIGPSKAKELIFTAKRLSGEEAFNYGIVNKVVDKDQVMIESEKLASEIITKGPIAIRMAKLAIDKGLQVDISGGLGIEEICYEQLIKTYDRKEGLLSFIEKRKPNYKGE